MQNRVALFSLSIALVAVAATSWAVDPATRKKGEPSVRTSTLGKLEDTTGDEMAIEGVFGDGTGALVTKYVADKDRWEGNYAMATGDAECPTAMSESKHWGKIWFKLSNQGRTFTGKYGKCDAEPSTDFTAEWDGK
jgi:hypothetical protein